MRFDVLTLFPEIFPGYLGQSLLRRAIAGGRVEVFLHNIRDWSCDQHKKVDDRPFGGGPGMVLMVDPVVRAVEAVRALAPDRGHLVMLTPQGRRLTQPIVEELAAQRRILLLCGRYEGFDERIRLILQPDEIIPRRLRPQRRRSRRHGRHRCRHPAGAGSPRRRTKQRRRFLFRLRPIPGIRPVHPAARVSRTGSAADPAGRRPRGDPAMAPGKQPAANLPAAQRPARSAQRRIRQRRIRQRRIRQRRIRHAGPNGADPTHTPEAKDEP